MFKKITIACRNLINLICLVGFAFTLGVNRENRRLERRSYRPYSYYSSYNNSYKDYYKR